MNKARTQTHHPPAKRNRRDHPVELEPFHQERSGELRQDVKDVKHRDGSVELGALEANVHGHALCGGEADVAAVEVADEHEEHHDGGDETV